jgi:hypothetical protein
VLFHGLRLADSQLNESATLVLGRLVVGPVPRLVFVAA